MLWTIVAVMALGLLLSMSKKSVMEAHAQRARWLGTLQIVWGLNAFFGAVVFALLDYDVLDKSTDYKLWKSLLMSSAFVFMVVVAGCQYVIRKAETGSAGLSRKEIQAQPAVRSGAIFVMLGVVALCSLFFV